jgi:fructose-1,6-bisphosphatase/inositol monophosphatase family enzyme
MLAPEEITHQVDAMLEIFRRLGQRIAAAAGKTAHTVKSDNSPVTELDVEIEGEIIRDFSSQFPDTPVYGEESGYQEGQEGTYWLIDPIDGTKSFLANITGYTIMAALIQNEEAVASVIYDPRDDDMYVALKGGGAFKNGQRLDLSNAPLPKVAYGRERLVDTITEILKPLGVTCEPGPSGSGYGFALVADGRLAARFNFPYQPGGGYVHDYAPGALLVREAGGKVISVEEDGTYTYRTRSFVACHPALEEIVRQNAKHLRQVEIATA